MVSLGSRRWVACLALISLAGCDESGKMDDPGPDAVVTSDAAVALDSGGLEPAKIYVTFVSHNERTLTRFGQYRESLSNYTVFRNSLLRFAGLIAAHGSKLSWQTDYVILDAIERHEAAALAADPTKTAGKPLLSYLRENLGVSVEAHAHECIQNGGNPSHCSDQPYNYADVVARIRTVGGFTPPAIIGGTTSAERTLDQWKACIRGNVFPENFCPEAITVFAGGTGGHTGGDDLHGGVWRPTSLLESGFLVDDPSSSIAYIGSGSLFATAFGARMVATEPVEFIRTHSAQIAAGTIPAGKIVTATIMIPEDKILTDDLYDELETMLVEIEQIGAGGHLVAATYPEVLAAWRTRYGSSASIFE